MCVRLDLGAIPVIMPLIELFCCNMQFSFGSKKCPMEKVVFTVAPGSASTVFLSSVVVITFIIVPYADTPSSNPDEAARLL